MEGERTYDGPTSERMLVDSGNACIRGIVRRNSLAETSLRKQDKSERWQ